MNAGGIGTRISALYHQLIKIMFLGTDLPEDNVPRNRCSWLKKPQSDPKQ